MIKQSQIDASIIIPTLGRLDKVIQLSNHLISLNPAPREIIIVFQEIDEYHNFLKVNKFPIIKPIFISTKSAVSARNAGLRSAQGEYLVFLDDDCKPIKSDWLDRITFQLKNPKISLVTGSVFGWGGVSGKIPFFNRSFLLLPIILEPIGNPEASRSGYCHTVAGGNFAAKKNQLDLIGGFNEIFTSPSLYEEIELSLRIKQLLKVKVWYEASAGVFHDQQLTGGMRNLNQLPTTNYVISQRKKLYQALYKSRTEISIRIISYYIFRGVVKLYKHISSVILK
jgi:glycosyltransferase involved in cell wall biosynthesis